MWKAVAAVLAAVMALSSGAAAGGMSEVGKSPPATRIFMAEESPEPVYVVRGDIEPGADDVFEAVIAARKGGWLVLASEGGDVSSAIWLGRMVRRHGIKTYVPTNGVCLSACAMVWAAGAERWVANGARLGFHRPWRLVEGKVVEGDVDRARRYFKELGYGDTAIRWFLVPPNDFFVLTAQSAKKIGVEANFRD